MVFFTFNTLQGLNGIFLHSKPMITLTKELTLEVSRDIVERQILTLPRESTLEDRENN